MRSNNSGNILFLILIAVALFAALSYAITSGSRTGEGAISAETEKLIAGRIASEISLVNNLVSRYHLSGISNLRIKDSISPVGCNTNVGGNICIFLPSNPYSLPPSFSYRQYDFTWLGIEGSQNRGIVGVGDNGLQDQVLYLEIPSEGICRLINKSLGVSGMPTSVGNYPEVVLNTGRTDLISCFKEPNGEYTLYYVVTAI